MKSNEIQEIYMRSPTPPPQASLSATGWSYRYIHRYVECAQKYNIENSDAWEGVLGPILGPSGPQGALGCLDGPVLP